MIRAAVAPYGLQVRLLMTIPGVDETAAWNLLAEMGADMSVFPDGDHCASWAGLSAGTNESAGIQHSARTKKGNRYLRRGLTQTAWVNSNRKGLCRSPYFAIAVATETTG